MSGLCAVPPSRSSSPAREHLGWAGTWLTTASRPGSSFHVQTVDVHVYPLSSRCQHCPDTLGVLGVSGVVHSPSYLWRGIGEVGGL